tara:strand:- start:518 stop:1000 length:483 start_codon:yes stop_codon:yes gene_type:complete
MSNKRIRGIHRNRLRPIRFADWHVYPSGKRLAKWLYKCECGNTKVILQSNVRDGKTNSCGCLASEVSRSKLPKMREAYKWSEKSGWQKGNEEYKKRKNYNTSETSKSKGLIRVYENPKDYTSRHCYLKTEHVLSLCHGIVPPEIRSKLSLCERTGNITIH